MYTALWMRDDPIDRTFMDATGFELLNCPTSEMRADGLTKFYETKAKWDYAVYMLGMRYSPDDEPVAPPRDTRSQVSKYLSSLYDTSDSRGVYFDT